MSTNRQPAGTSIGGQWAPGAASEVDDSLDPVDDGVRDHALDREMSERFGVNIDDCPGLREKWNETYDVGGDASPRTNRLRADHIEEMAQGTRPPWSVLAESDEYEKADRRVKGAVVAVSDNQIGHGISASTVQASRVYAKALRGESGTPSRHTPAISPDSLEVGREQADGDYMHMEPLDQKTVARLNRGVIDGDESAKAEAGTHLQSLDGLAQIGDDHNHRVDFLTSALNGHLDNRWKLGWSGDPEKMPARPNRVDPAKRHI